MNTEIIRLKLRSEQTEIKKFNYRIYCLFCCTFLCDQETDTDGRCVIKPDRKRINEASFVKLKT